MKAIISPGHMSGVVCMPPSKSMMQRACAAALLHDHSTIITNPGTSDDDRAALNIIHELGAEVYATPDNTIEIISTGVQPRTGTLHCGESGLSARLFIPIAALSHHDITITGTGSLMHRPMAEYVSALPLIGVSTLATNNCLPMSIRGPIQVHDMMIDGSRSSQFLSGLLLTYSFIAEEPVTIFVAKLKSRPYVDMTLEMLKQYGKYVINDEYNAFTVVPHMHQPVGTVEIEIEGDWSAGANFIVAQAMGADVYIKGLNENSVQADAAITQVVNGNNPFEFDATHCPDLFPILAVYAAFCNGVSKIKGLHRLKHKESDRAESTYALLYHLGVSFVLSDNDELIIVSTGRPFRSCTVNSHNDHRIVMAASIATLNATGPITINGAEAVNKSYPAFFEDLLSLGVDCQLVN